MSLDDDFRDQCSRRLTSRAESASSSPTSAPRQPISFCTKLFIKTSKTIPIQVSPRSPFSPYQKTWRDGNLSLLNRLAFFCGLSNPLNEPVCMARISTWTTISLLNHPRSNLSTSSHTSASPANIRRNIRQRRRRHL